MISESEKNKIKLLKKNILKRMRLSLQIKSKLPHLNEDFKKGYMQCYEDFKSTMFPKLEK